MKQILEIYKKKYMVRPIFYKCVTKASVILALGLLWDRFLNQSRLLSMPEHAFFILGCITMLLSWFNYLKLDGMRLQYRNEKPQNKRKRHRTKDVADFVDEKVISFDELEEDEQAACRLASNLFTGLAFVLISMAAALF